MKYQKCTWILALHYRWTFLSIRCKFKSRHKKFQRTWCVDLLNRQYANSVTKRSHRFLWRFTITTCDGYSQIWCNSGTFLTAISAYCCGSKNYHISTYTNRVSNKTKIKNDQQTIKRLVDSVKPYLRFQAIFVKLPYCHLIKISVDENWNFKMLKPPFYYIVFIFKHLYNLKNDQKRVKQSILSKETKVVSKFS